LDLFDWFKPAPPSNVTVLPDVIWLSKQAKFDGLIRAVSKALAGPEPPDGVLLVGHFPDTVAELRRPIEDGRISGSVAVVSVDDLRGTAAGMSLDDSRTILFVVGERHPLRSRDEAIAEFAEGLPCRSRLVHYVSLDEPLMRVFAGGWVEGTLKKLGMKEDEAVESPLVARRIKAARDKLAGRCSSDFPAESAEAWMEKNYAGP
jgi:hypothetical protein